MTGNRRNRLFVFREYFDLFDKRNALTGKGNSRHDGGDRRKWIRVWKILYPEIIEVRPEPENMEFDGEYQASRENDRDTRFFELQEKNTDEEGNRRTRRKRRRGRGVTTMKTMVTIRNEETKEERSCGRRKIRKTRKIILSKSWRTGKD